jgi:hypothetical protein
MRPPRRRLRWVDSFRSGSFRFHRIRAQMIVGSMAADTYLVIHRAEGFVGSSVQRLRHRHAERLRDAFRGSGSLHASGLNRAGFLGGSRP